MKWLSSIFSGGVGTLVEKVGNVVDKFHLSDEEKGKLELEMTALVQSRDSEIEQTVRSTLQAKERVLVAELNQGDSYTKRARPTVVYAGLLFIFFNYVLVPILSEVLGTRVEPFDLPEEFWYGWSGIVMSWSLGRTVEKRGISVPATRALTGTKSRDSLLD